MLSLEDIIVDARIDYSSSCHCFAIMMPLFLRSMAHNRPQTIAQSFSTPHQSNVANFACVTCTCVTRSRWLALQGKGRPQGAQFSVPAAPALPGPQRGLGAPGIVCPSGPHTPPWTPLR